MASRAESAVLFAALADNGYWRQYVSMLRARREAAVTELLYGPVADEALRGRARALDELLLSIEKDTPK